MKQTLTINLNGIVFNIDDDAYQNLRTYLTTIEANLGNGDDTTEIMADIEARIAELLSAKLAEKRQNVVENDMVEQIEATMGTPSDFGSGASESTASQAHENTNKNAKKNKHFYRDTDNAILGGVASGLAAYIGMDATLMRILFLLILFIGVGFVVPIYFIIWMITPAATTAAQRLEMRGESPTVENIKKEFSNAQNYVQSDDFKKKTTSISQKIGSVLLAIFKVCLVLVGCFFGFIAISVLIALGIACLVLVFGVSTTVPFIPFSLGFITGWQGVVLAIAGVLLISIPLFNLIFGIITYLRTKHWLSTPYRLITLGLWILSLVAMLWISLPAIKNNTWDWNWQNNTQNDAPSNTETRTLDAFHSIDASGAFHVKLAQADEQTVSVSSNNPSNILTEVRDSVLYISSNGQPRYWNADVTISANNIKQCTLRGSCSVESENTISQPNFSLNLEGASKADLHMNVDSLLRLTANGASDIELEGFARNADINLAGASKMDADDLLTHKADLCCAGGSKVDLWCDSMLSVQAYGASKVQYKGNPTLSKRIAVGASKIEAER